MTKPSKLSKRLESLGHAGAGLAALVRREPNARIHLAASVAVAATGAALGLTVGEWTAIVLAATLVWVAEAINTALEILCDVVHPGYHPSMGLAKDIAAGAVLASAIGAAFVGALIFLPQVI